MPFNSTISVKKKICRSCGKLSYIFSRHRCADCSRIEDSTKRLEKETNRLIQQEDLSELIPDCDAIFSKYIRLKYSDSRGECKCYTCNTKKHWTMMQNGHYISRGNLYLRWDERNCRPQDEHCNCYLHGNIPEFTKRLEAEHKGITEILREEANLIFKPSREEIKQLINEYTQKVRQLKTKFNK